MQLVPFSPLRELDRLSSELDHLLTPNGGFFGWTPAVDIVENDESMLIPVELPGLSRDDVQLNIEDNVLTISGERKHKEEFTKGQVTRRESFYGKFQRAFRLPNTLDTGKAEARMDNGVLEIVLPKREEAKPKQISISVN